MPLYGELPEIQTSAGDAIHGFPVQILRPAKTAVLRLPTNQEMSDYLNQQKTLYRDLGRRKGQSESVPNPKSDLDLFNHIRIDKGPEFDEAEAARAIGLLTRQRVTSCEREGEAYRIKLLTVFGETEHVINIPFEKELAVYRRNVFKAIDLPHGVEERRYPPEAAERLYDAAVVSVLGYVDSITKENVPPHHKSTVVLELVSAIGDLDPELPDPNN
jgi:hypothetical protein